MSAAMPPGVALIEQGPVIQGDVVGKNVIIGHNNLQITGDGCRVAVIDPRNLPSPKPRAKPLAFLPRAPRPFAGRGAECHALFGALAPSTLIELVGPPGIGKSWLMRQLAQTPVPALPDGVVFPTLPVKGLPAEDVCRELFDCCFERFSSPELAYLPTRAELIHGLQSLQALILLEDLELPPEEARSVFDAVRNCGILYARVEPLLPEARRFTLTGLGEHEFWSLAHEWLGRAPTAAEWSAISAAAHGSQGAPGAVWQTVLSLRQPRASTPLARQLMLVLAAVNGVALELSTLEGIMLSATGPSAREQLRQELEALCVAGTLQVEEDAGARSQRYALHPRLKGAFDGDPELREWTRRTLAFFAASGAERTRRERPALLALLLLAFSLGLCVEVVQCVRVVATHLLALGALGSWSRVLELHGRAAQTLQNVGELGWFQHESGVRALSEGNSAAAATFFEAALALRQQAGDASGLALTQQARALIAPAAPAPLASAPVKAGTKALALGGGAAALVGAAVLVVVFRPNATTPTQTVRATAPAQSVATAVEQSAPPGAACHEGQWQLSAETITAIQVAPVFRFESVDYVITGKENGTMVMTTIGRVQSSGMTGTARSSSTARFEETAPGSWKLSGGPVDVQCELKPAALSSLCKSLAPAFIPPTSEVQATVRCEGQFLTIEPTSTGTLKPLKLERVGGGGAQ